MSMIMRPEHLDNLLHARLADPFAVLGMHRENHGRDRVLVCRTFRPEARQVVVCGRHGHGRHPAERVHPEGVFEAVIQGGGEHFAYELEVTGHDGTVHVVRDPYSFWPILAADDQYLFNEGSHFCAYDKLGAHLLEIDGAAGVLFAVWAPAASRVSVVGDFNRWDGRRHMMRSLGSSGLWELFLPGLQVGAVYKYELTASTGEILVKTDPYGFGTEVPPRTASIVCDLAQIQWNDAEWMARRQRWRPLTEPMAIYEIHAGSWRWDPKTGEPLDYRKLAHQLVPYVKDLGFTHVELMPIAEHPFSGSWGYQITAFFAPTARYGSPQDFAYFVDYCHAHDLGVIIDWVPGHFPKDGHGLARFDGTALYEHDDPRQGLHPDWDTLIFNYGRDEVRSFLFSNAIFWLHTYHVDGLRVDAVASMLYLDYSREGGDWIPNSQGGRENLEAITFLRQLNAEVYSRFPGAMTIAEESTAWPAVSRPAYSGGLGFGFKWNMGWMNDVLRYLTKEPVHRKYHHADLTFSMLYAYNENFILPLSHDEVVHGKRSLLDKMPGDMWQMFANLRLLLSFQWAHPGKKLLFMGGEFGQWTEWNHENQLDWSLLDFDSHKGIQRLVLDLNSLYCTSPALHASDHHPDGFRWIDCQDIENGVVAFLRSDSGSGQFLVFVLNSTPVVRRSYRIGVPRGGQYREVLNTDSAWYGGGDVGNGGSVPASRHPWHSYPFSMELVLPPLGMVALEPVDG